MIASITFISSYRLILLSSRVAMSFSVIITFDEIERIHKEVLKFKRIEANDVNNPDAGHLTNDLH